MNETKPTTETRIIQVITQIMKDINWQLKNASTPKGIKIGEIIEAPEYTELFEEINTVGKNADQRNEDLKKLEAFFQTWNTEMDKYDDKGNLKPLN